VAVGYIETTYGRWSFREVDWTEAKEKAANIAANQHGGQFEDDGLKKLLREIASLEFDLTLTGLDVEEMDSILGAQPGQVPASSPGQPQNAPGSPPPNNQGQEQYPVYAILSREEHARWANLKNGLTDKNFILELIKNVA
jgi:hypothetical protein